MTFLLVKVGPAISTTMRLRRSAADQHEGRTDQHQHRAAADDDDVARAAEHDVTPAKHRLVDLDAGDTARSLLLAHRFAGRGLELLGDFLDLVGERRATAWPDAAHNCA